MAKNLMEFLAKNPVAGTTTEVDLGGRLKGMPFTIKSITNEEYQSYQKASMFRARKGSQTPTEFNAQRFNELVVVNHVVEPDFRDAKFLETLGVVTPEDGINKTLLAGEVAALSEEIFKFSGFGNSMDEEIEEAKN